MVRQHPITPNLRNWSAKVSQNFPQFILSRAGARVKYNRSMFSARN